VIAGATSPEHAMQNANAAAWEPETNDLDGLP
jgi:hypothetical protein